MPTKLSLSIKIGDAWEDASHIIDNGYVWHRTEKICNWYKGKIAAVTKADQAKFTCTTETLAKNTNFLMSPMPKEQGEVSPLAVLLLGAVIVIMAWNIWKKM